MRTIPTLGIVTAGVLLGIIGCKVTPNAPPPDPLRAALAGGNPADVALTAGPIDRALGAVLAPAAAIRGAYSLFYGSSACLSRSGNPICIPRPVEPRAGHHVIVDWSTRPTTPPAAERFPCWLLVSTKHATDIALDPWGGIGCHLLVLPDFVLTPEGKPPGEGLLTQQGGSVHLEWVPDVVFIGTTWWMQLVVGDPTQNSYGYLLSPGLRITVGAP